MRYCRGFTLIEVMIVVVVIALLAAIGYPSYREHIARGQRSEGQQFLSDVAQRQEQILLDRREYVIYGNTGLTKPPGAKYDDPVITPSAGPPPSFSACMNPASGSYLAARGDGRICINNTGQRWREPVGGNGIFESGSGECAWENRSCKITGES
jgi:type IV pilus assembly protein PilE